MFIIGTSSVRGGAAEIRNSGDPLRLPRPPGCRRRHTENRIGAEAALVARSVEPG